MSLYPSLTEIMKNLNSQLGFSRRGLKKKNHIKVFSYWMMYEIAKYN